MEEEKGKRGEGGGFGIGGKKGGEKELDGEDIEEKAKKD